MHKSVCINNSWGRGKEELLYFIDIARSSSLRLCEQTAKKLSLELASGPALKGAECLAPPINKLSLLKKAACVLNFKFWPPLINTWPPKSTALAPTLACIMVAKA